MATALMESLRSNARRFLHLRKIHQQVSDERRLSDCYRHYGAWSSSDKETPILRDTEDLARYIKKKASNIFVMVGAGISTPSGIPDFRSPGTGLYDNLEKYKLPYPEAIFDINYFMMDPRPFYTLAQDLYPGLHYSPNTAHHFLRLLQDEGKLQVVYTQNIDGLEKLAGVMENNLVEAHGTFSGASCSLCGRTHSSQVVKAAIFENRVPMCEAARCKGKVKPDIVFFGENLPERFWDHHHQLALTDLLLVIGTSLEVYPFAGVAEGPGQHIPRVLINRDPAGTLGSRPRDLLLLGDLVVQVRSLVKALGWQDKLQQLEDHYNIKVKSEE